MAKEKQTAKKPPVKEPKSSKKDMQEEKRLRAKKELALQVIGRLKAEYPDAGCTLDYNQAWKLLVSVRLAAQCTDARVNEQGPGYQRLYEASAGAVRRQSTR